MIVSQVKCYADDSFFERVEKTSALGQEQLDHYRKIKLEEKQIEILARMKMLNTPQVYQTTNTYVSNKNKNNIESKMESNIKVK